MKKKKKHIILLFNLIAITIFTSCDAEKEFISRSSIAKETNSEISFSEFLKETKINEFKTKISIPSSKQSLVSTSQNSKLFLEFDVNTKIIKKLKLDKEVIYTFRIFPQEVIAPTNIYNLTVSFKNGEWVQNIIELKPNSENLDNLLSGSTSNIQGQISVLFSSNVNTLTSLNNNFTLEIIGNNCNNPKISENCVSRKYGSFIQINKTIYF